MAEMLSEAPSLPGDSRDPVFLLMVSGQIQSGEVCASLRVQGILTRVSYRNLFWGGGNFVSGGMRNMPP